MPVANAPRIIRSRIAPGILGSISSPLPKDQTATRQLTRSMVTYSSYRETLTGPLGSRMAQRHIPASHIHDLAHPISFRSPSENSVVSPVSRPWQGVAVLRIQHYNSLSLAF